MEELKRLRGLDKVLVSELHAKDARAAAAERALAVEKEENDFLHAALDAFEWQRINSMSVLEVKKELLEAGYTEERLAEGMAKIMATVSKSRSALDAAKGDKA